MSATTPGGLFDEVSAALDEVIDPCSVGRQLSAGLNDMGMVKSVEFHSFKNGMPTGVIVSLQITSPGCTFQTWFDDRVRQEITHRLPELECEVRWSTDLDWSDESMSDSLKLRARQKRERVLLTLGRAPA